MSEIESSRPADDPDDATGGLQTSMRRRLFLDDDPARAAVFLKRHPRAVWVQTALECLERLGERWEEIHLDHDLGGETFVATDRADCGMEVVRWLTASPRPHLRRARFTIHSHNMVAAYEMVLRLSAAGFRVSARPFGASAPAAPPKWLDLWRRWRFGTALRLRLFAGRLGTRPESAVASADPTGAGEADRASR